jgi:hypothetical protein
MKIHAALFLALLAAAAHTGPRISANYNVPTMWEPLTMAMESDEDFKRTVTDLNAVGPTKFYRVEITKP